MVPVEVIKKPPKVMHRLVDVGKSIPPLPKAATTVTTRSQEKLVTAKVSAPCSTSIEHVRLVVPVKQDNKASATISLVRKSDVVTAVVGMDVVEEAEP
jgi:hypothetical protein